MSVDTCPTCRDFVWTTDGRMETSLGNAHRCQPVFTVWCPEYDQAEDDGVCIRAHDAESAAEKWAEREDRESADYSIVGGSSVSALVRAADGTLTRWSVSGESVPRYSAREETIEEGAMA